MGEAPGFQTWRASGRKPCLQLHGQLNGTGVLELNLITLCSSESLHLTVRLPSSPSSSSIHLQRERECVCLCPTPFQPHRADAGAARTSPHVGRASGIFCRPQVLAPLCRHVAAPASALCGWKGVKPHEIGIVKIGNYSYTGSTCGTEREFTPFQPHRADAGAARTSPGRYHNRVFNHCVEQQI